MGVFAERRLEGQWLGTWDLHEQDMLAELVEFVAEKPEGLLSGTSG